jgi:hypothetical protein
MQAIVQRYVAWRGKVQRQLDHRPQASGQGRPRAERHGRRDESRTAPTPKRASHGRTVRHQATSYDGVAGQPELSHLEFGSIEVREINRRRFVTGTDPTTRQFAAIPAMATTDPIALC